MSGHGSIGERRATHRRSLRLVLAITLGILVVEVVGGIAARSLALLADAAHVLTDVAAIGLSLAALWFASRPASRGRTYGHYRVEILAAVVNAVLLFGISGLILYQAVRDLDHPRATDGTLMIVVGLIALGANAASMFILRRDQKESLNLRGAFLEVMSDALGAAAVVVAAAVMLLSGFRRADALAAILIALLILPRTWRLLRDAVDVLLEATPKGVDLSELRRHIVTTEGVADAHDLHVWSITSGMNVVSAHVVLSEGASPPRVLDSLSACLSGDFDIEHSTFQLELSDRSRLEETAHE